MRVIPVGHFVPVVKQYFLQDGIYDYDTLNGKIVNDGYIPVASLSELQSFSANTNQLMGYGTDWEGYYTTGADKKYVQTNHIFSLSDEIGINTPFSGEYDGNECKIQFPNLLGRSLFITVTGFVKNIRAYYNITAGASIYYVAGIASILSGGIVDNCQYTGNISAKGLGNGGVVGSVSNDGVVANSKAYGTITTTFTSNSETGGLIGIASGAITNCSAHNAVSSAGQNVGGLIGKLSEGTISKCYATGTVSNNVAIHYYGGFVGANYGTIENCYAKGDVTTDGYYAASFCGRNYATGVIEKCYGTGAVTGIANYIKGFCGLNNNSCVDNYYNMETSGLSDTVGATPKTTAQMMQQTTFPNWDFINIWNISEGILPPYFRLIQ